MGEPRCARLSDNRLDLRKEFGAKREAGVAYGAARVEAKCETPAVLRRGRAMGVTVTFNGHRRWSARSMIVWACHRRRATAFAG